MPFIYNNILLFFLKGYYMVEFEYFQGNYYKIMN